MEFLNVSRQRAAEPSATGRALSKAAGFVTEGGCWQQAGDAAAVALLGSAASPGCHQHCRGASSCVLLLCCTVGYLFTYDVNGNILM